MTMIRPEQEGGREIIGRIRLMVNVNNLQRRIDMTEVPFQGCQFG